jgi:hypothetical protein
MEDLRKALGGNNKVTGVLKHNKYVQGYTPEIVKPIVVPVPVHVPIPVEPINYYDNPIDTDTFLTMCLNIIDPNICILTKEGVKKHIDPFKVDLAKNLDNDKQLYKKFGFSRKKSINIDSMKSFFNQENTDLNITPEVFTYLSKLLQKNICIVDFSLIVRSDYVHDVLSDWIMFKFENNKYNLYCGKDNIPIFIEKEVFSRGHLSKEKLDQTKANELKKLCKMVALTKDDLLEKYKK